MLRYFLLLFTVTLGSKFVDAQISIGSTSPSASVMLEVNATSKGFLPLRVALSSINDVTTIADWSGIYVASGGTVEVRANFEGTTNPKRLPNFRQLFESDHPVMCQFF